MMNFPIYVCPISLFIVWELTWWLKMLVVSPQVFPIDLCFIPAAGLHLKTKSALRFFILFLILGFMIMRLWLKKPPFREFKQILAPVSRLKKKKMYHLTSTILFNLLIYNKNHFLHQKCSRKRRQFLCFLFLFYCWIFLEFLVSFL